MVSCVERHDGVEELQSPNANSELPVTLRFAEQTEQGPPTSKRGGKWRILKRFQHLYSSVNPTLPAREMSRQATVDDEPWANS